MPKQNIINIEETLESERETGKSFRWPFSNAPCRRKIMLVWGVWVYLNSVFLWFYIAL